MKRFFICLAMLLVLIPSLCWGATYYVDCSASAGGDGSLSAPWDALSDVNGATLSAGDNVYLKRGCTFREQLTIPNSGSSGHPITFGAYGTGAKPIISGADVVTAEWGATVTEHVYRSLVGSITQPSQLYVDGVFYDVAHYPDNYAGLTVSSNGATALEIIDVDETFTEEQVVGATVKTKVYSWDVSSSIGAAYDSGSHKITTTAPNYVYKDSATIKMLTAYNSVYWLENLPWMISVAGEWAYTSSDGYLYLWAPDDGDPTGHTVEYSARDYCIYLNGKNYVTLENLQVEKANVFNIYALSSDHFSVTGVDSVGGRAGVSIRTSSYADVDNCDIGYALNDGIITASPTVFTSSSWSTSDSQCSETDISITNSNVHDIGTIGTIRHDSDVAIGGCGQNWVISDNTITNAAYIGINMMGSGETSNNTITNVVTQMADGGALYSHDQQDIAAGTKTFHHNTINGVPGMMMDGSAPTTGVQAQCIYLDGYASETSVYNNLCIDCNEGLLNNGGENNSWYNNTVYGSLRYYLSIAELFTNAAYSNALTGLKIKNNVFYITKASLSYASPMKLYSARNATIANFGEIDYNIFYHNNYYYTAWDAHLDVLNIDVAPATDWAYGDKITGQSSGAYVYVMAKLTATTYSIYSKSGTFTLGEIIGVTGTSAKLADQGAEYPTITVNSGSTSHIFSSLAAWQAYTSGTLGTNWDANSKEINPLFVNPAGDDFHLRSSSPAINAGVNVCTGVGTPFSTCTGSGTGTWIDLDNQTVPYGALPDIGAYEWRPINIWRAR